MRAAYVILFLVGPPAPAPGDRRHGPSRVLFLSSYHPAFPSFFPQVSGLREVLEAYDVELDVEFMDSKRFFNDVNFAHFTTLLRHKLENCPPYDCPGGRVTTTP